MTDTRNAQQAALSRQHFGNLAQGPIFLFLDKKMEVRVNVAASRAHHQAFLGRQAHRGVHALAVTNRRGAASIAKMRREKLRLLDRFADPFGGL